MMDFAFIGALLAALVFGSMIGYAARLYRPWPYAVMIVALAAGAGSGAHELVPACVVATLGCIGMIVGSLAEPPERAAGS